MRNDLIPSNGIVFLYCFVYLTRDERERERECVCDAGIYLADVYLFPDMFMDTTEVCVMRMCCAIVDRHKIYLVNWTKY